MTKEEKQAYYQLKRYFGADRWENIFICGMFMPLLWDMSWESSMWDWILGSISIVGIISAQVYSYVKSRKAKAVLKWEAYEAEVVDLRNFRTKFNQHRFDAVCQFSDAHGQAHIATEKNVQIPLVPKLYRPSGEVKVDYAATAYVNPQQPEQVHFVIRGTGRDAQTGLFN